MIDQVNRQKDNKKTNSKTRFAPSPTGFLHLGNIRSAIYPWAFARSTGGQLILRIEDTDIERFNPNAVATILDSMQWLGLDYDEGPFYQTKRLHHYQSILTQLLKKGFVYPCYTSPSELEILRAEQLARKEKPRYDGTWRPEPGKILPSIPKGVKPVLRFKCPKKGIVAWEDKVKGKVEVSNEELDDFVIARPSMNNEDIGIPTYNFSVVVDDIDMGITHVIRGDDHINNTPKQIHIFRALGHTLPTFAHIPTVLDNQGNKLSKRTGAKSILEYRQEGYLPQAIINYLARLGWSHGDDELFTPEQLVEWFNLENLGSSATQFDEAKLRWVNHQHIKMLDNVKLAAHITPYLKEQGITLDQRLPHICGLFKERSHTLLALSQWASYFYTSPTIDPTSKMTYENHITRKLLKTFTDQLQDCPWDQGSIASLIKRTLKEEKVKMPLLAKPIRLCLLGDTNGPSLDATLYLMTREEVIKRLSTW
jgi:glutamyl-tRNA synthetase